MRFLETVSVVASTLHLPKQNQPQSAGQENHNARIEKSQVPHFALELKLQQHVPNPKRQDNRRDDAHHPCREKTAEHVDRRRSAAPGPEESNEGEQRFS
jgi:hypothetical protein